MNHIFKKKFGQNFLRDENVLNFISNYITDSNYKIIEIGAGDGALTKKLIEKNRDVISFEIDNSLKNYLDVIKCDRLKIVYEDFLNVNLRDYINNEKFSVVANVPYYITTPIITKFIDEDFIPEEMILMVQYEVAKRLSSDCGSKEYGAISVILNYFFEIEFLLKVDRNKFYPSPNVDSAVIKFIKRNNNNFVVNNYDKFVKVVNDSFSHKRKTLKNNLINYDLNKINYILNKYNLSINNRAEEVDYKIYVDISNNI